MLHPLDFQHVHHRPKLAMVAPHLLQLASHRLLLFILVVLLNCHRASNRRDTAAIGDTPQEYAGIPHLDLCFYQAESFFSSTT